MFLKSLLNVYGKKMLVAAWLLTPVALVGLHYGPGQRAVAADRVSTAAGDAKAAEASGDWKAAAAAWRLAIAEVPGADADGRAQLTLKYEMARVMYGELPEALEETAKLLAEAEANGVSAPAQREVRAQLGAMNYWAAWLMRLEGAAASDWEPVCDEARQNFRLLAESEPAGSDVHKRNLEASIRLARMDLADLQGLPLPKECKACKNCTGKCQGQKAGRCNNLSDQKKDARNQVQTEKTKSAGVNNRSGEAGW